jgi:hypothetical protein
MVRRQARPVPSVHLFGNRFEVARDGRGIEQSALGACDRVELIDQRSRRTDGNRSCGALCVSASVLAHRDMYAGPTVETLAIGEGHTCNDIAR